MNYLTMLVTDVSLENKSLKIDQINKIHIDFSSVNWTNKTQRSHNLIDTIL